MSGYTPITYDDLRGIIVDSAVKKCGGMLNGELDTIESTREFWCEQCGCDEASGKAVAERWGALIWLSTPSYVADLVNGYAKEWVGCKDQLGSLLDTCRTAKQGCYLDVQLEFGSDHSDDEPISSSTYGGSAFGAKGVEKRVFDEHLDPDYRAEHPSKHYTEMEKPGVKPYFVALSIFQDKQPMEVVTLAESIWAGIFGAQVSRFNRENRHPSLPALRPEGGLNVVDPVLTEGEYEWMRARNDSARECLFRNTQSGARFEVHQRSGDVREWTFSVSGLTITINSDVAKKLGFDKLGEDDYLDVQVNFECTKDGSSHPNKWATKSIDSDEGAGLAILVSNDGISGYLRSGTARAVASANTLFDLCTDKFTVQDLSWMREQDWGSDRHPFVGPYSGAVSHSTWDTYFGDPVARHAAKQAGRPWPLPEWVFLASKVHRWSGADVLAQKACVEEKEALAELWMPRAATEAWLPMTYYDQYEFIFPWRDDDNFANNTWSARCERYLGSELRWRRKPDAVDIPDGHPAKRLKR
ncbi:hypothetical protein KCU61_g9504, partial [Aureobasidium melanogenum]